MEESAKQKCYTSSNTTILTLSVCSFLNDFTCDDGSCINKYKRCDDTVDCDDHSDEENCTVVKLSPDYRKSDPPKLQDNKVKCRLKTNSAEAEQCMNTVVLFVHLFGTPCIILDN